MTHELEIYVYDGNKIITEAKVIDFYKIITDIFKHGLNISENEISFCGDCCPLSIKLAEETTLESDIIYYPPHSIVKIVLKAYDDIEKRIEDICNEIETETNLKKCIEKEGFHP